MDMAGCIVVGQAGIPYARSEKPSPGAVSVDDLQRSAFFAVRASFLDEVAAEIDRYAASGTTSLPERMLIGGGPAAA